MDKLDLFFELLTAVYGRAKVAAQWPTERDEQIVRALVADKIASMDMTDIRAAIDNARKMRVQEQRGWDWPDVDLILAGAKKHLNASHRPFLPEPPREIASKEQAAQFIASMREALK